MTVVLGGGVASIPKGRTNQQSVVVVTKPQAQPSCCSSRRNKRGGVSFPLPLAGNQRRHLGHRSGFPKPLRVVAEENSVAETTPSTSEIDLKFRDLNDYVRHGGSERKWLLAQANKTHKNKTHDKKISSLLKPFPPLSEGETSPSKRVDILVVGCGPAGLALACELAEKSKTMLGSGSDVKIGLVGPDVPFVNTYGVWEDEFQELGLTHCLEKVYKDAVNYFGEDEKGRVQVPRKYAKVDLQKLQDHLLKRCKDAGVFYEEGEVSKIDGEKKVDVVMKTAKNNMANEHINCDLAILASGAASSAFLEYETGAPDAGAQTAYGVEVEIEDYPFDKNSMHFMDFRRHHSGLWPGTALESRTEDWSWGTKKEMPSFLYAMYLGGNKAFFQETCLVSKDAVPFKVLKRRLETRLDSLDVKVKRVLDEEWSYIPVGGPLPKPEQNVLAYGAAANLVHPASGYSVAKSLTLAPTFASEICEIWKSRKGWDREASEEAWRKLWSDEKRRCQAFHVFGMELLALMDVGEINTFFRVFFQLPERLWRGFLGAKLSSLELILFAGFMWLIAPVNLKNRLVLHLMMNDSGKYLINNYVDTLTKGDKGD
eukprot:CAMPEP_0197470940 /NCGR_PEP_ID=MMETSP1309-20131121/1740_1 /TAXON_ID=464262 /ORGANISM="Genus nov. species nov., Strain RCC998" /LENGTH=596 /DNA_ID=CAMNT_0043008217 /DNA_START=280 /DNA_END=2070 /DNA_ORIENTATION=+